MHYLVDGHNLIAHLPGIELSDPEDEAKLVELLHRFVLRHPGHRITVVFDGGVYGHPAPPKRDRVEAIFARSPGDADTRLISLLERATPPQSYTLVSSDRAIAAAAKARRIAAKPSAIFALELQALGSARPRLGRRLQPEPKPSRAELEEWLKLFGADQD